MAADVLRVRLMQQLKRWRLTPQQIAVELHDYDYQKRVFGRPIEPEGVMP